MEASVVRATQPTPSTGTHGIGISIQLWCHDEPGNQYCEPSSRSAGSVVGSVVEQNHELGVLFMGADATLEASVVRETVPLLSGFGYGSGVAIEMACLDTPSGLVCDPRARANAKVVRSVIDTNHQTGLLVLGSDATIDALVVRRTDPTTDGSFGDGVAVVGGAGMEGARVTLQHSDIRHSARAGVGAFGAFVSLEATRIACAAFEIEGEPFGGADYELEDRGGNLCGCDRGEVCHAVTAGIAPPIPP
jgi:hypothetical protein